MFVYYLLREVYSRVYSSERIFFTRNYKRKLALNSDDDKENIPLPLENKQQYFSQSRTPALTNQTYCMEECVLGGNFVCLFV
ncbi:hypothetical protein RclHR1_03060022 [Rhizophagus clarus]|uniref:Uncharacterized protein n=1 Tax=Rhizophagus clarus TaxID=94130 RepID=A0A2Z6R6I1_9GLOM|nr:hypothetical protein RclHR1_03060022 [Rhizophagus clarus]